MKRISSQRREIRSGQRLHDGGRRRRRRVAHIMKLSRASIESKPLAQEIRAFTTFSVKELMEPRGVWSYSSYSIACDTGRLRRSRCKNMNVGTIRSISSDNIR